MKMLLSQTLFTADLLAQRIRSIGEIAAHESELLASLQQRPRIHGAGADIVTPGEATAHPRIIVAGWACRPRILPDGRCQMLSILLPGDVAGDTSEDRPLALSPVMALSTVRTISAKPVFDAIAADPSRFAGLQRMLRRLARMEEEQLLDHVVRLGRQTALQRVAHYLLELFHRLDPIGFVHQDRFALPLTQEVLSDVLGLSLVHVNRTLSQLRRDRLVEIRGGLAIMLDLPRMTELAGFRPAGGAVAAGGSVPLQRAARY